VAPAPAAAAGLPSAPNGALKAAAKASPAPSPGRERSPPAPPSPAATQLAKVGAGATPRRREKKDAAKEADIVKRLQAICTDADPTRLYRNLVKIGQGCALRAPPPCVFVY
jgi:p21-activated kinase 1